MLRRRRRLLLAPLAVGERVQAAAKGGADRLADDAPTQAEELRDAARHLGGRAEDCPSGSATALGNVEEALATAKAVGEVE